MELWSVADCRTALGFAPPPSEAAAGIIPPPPLITSRRPRIAVHRAIAWQAAGAAFTALVSFALLAWLARKLGAAGFGEYIWLLSLAVVALLAVEGGWPAWIYRESATSRTTVPAPDARAARRHILLASALGAAVGAVVVGAALAIALLCMGGVALANLVSGRLRGEGRFGAEALWQAGVRVGTAGAIVVAVQAGAPVPAGIFAAWALALALLVPWAHAAWLRGGAAQSVAWHASLALVGLEAALVLLQRGDMATLGWLGWEPDDLAHYAAGTRVTELAVLALAPVNNVLLRSLRQAWPDRAPFLALVWRAWGAAVAIGVLACLLSLPWGGTLLALAFGAPFREAGALLPWILAGLPALLGLLVLAQATIAQERERRVLRWLLPGALFALGALAAGALLYGPRGAAAGFAVAQTLLMAAALRAVLRAEPGA